MNNKLLIGLVIGALVLGGVVYVVTNQKTATTDKQTMKKEEKETMTKDATSPRYVAYSKEAFDAASEKKRVLYFHASWCPVCRPLDKEFSENSGKIPEDVILFKTEYDKEEALKIKYGVTYQHTFVQVDGQGNEAISWNGGGISELLAKVK